MIAYGPRTGQPAPQMLPRTDHGVIFTPTRHVYRCGGCDRIRVLSQEWIDAPPVGHFEVDEPGTYPRYCRSCTTGREIPQEAATIPTETPESIDALRDAAAYEDAMREEGEHYTCDAHGCTFQTVEWKDVTQHYLRTGHTGYVQPNDEQRQGR